MGGGGGERGGGEQEVGGGGGGGGLRGMVKMVIDKKQCQLCKRLNGQIVPVPLRGLVMCIYYGDFWHGKW